MRTIFFYVAVLTVGVMGEMNNIPLKYITNSLHRKIALEVLRVSPVNTVVSPLLLKFSLCKLASVARGTAKFEIMIALGFTTEAMIRNCYKEHRTQIQYMKMTDVMTTSKIYLNDSLDVDPLFMQNATEEYGLRVEKVGFRYPTAASNFINNWVQRDMLKRVTNIIDAEDINTNTSMVILNAAHFKSTWETPFRVELSTEKKFHDMKGTIWRTPMMVTLEDIPFLDDPNLEVKLIKMSFVQASILYAMPLSNTGLPKFLTKIVEDPDIMTDLISRMQRKVLSLAIPKFKIKSYVDWTGFLKLIGINQIMNQTTSGLHHILRNGTNKKVYLSKVKQKVFMEVDEFGAIRKPHDERESPVVLERLVGGLERSDEFVLDKPFYFVISFRNQKSETDMLHGVYYGPQEV